MISYLYIRPITNFQTAYHIIHIYVCLVLLTIFIYLLYYFYSRNYLKRGIVLNHLETLDDYFKEKRDEHLEQLKEFLRIPSISALSEHKGDMQKAAEWLLEFIQKSGA